MELEIITPKKKKKLETVTIQLTIQTPEEFATLLAVANSGALMNELKSSESDVSRNRNVSMSNRIFTAAQYYELEDIFQQYVTNQSK